MVLVKKNCTLYISGLNYLIVFVTFEQLLDDVADVRLKSIMLFCFYFFEALVNKYVFI